ncbi:EAL and HDOD domain-containing protein [Fundidesulfovibrio terrae]|uniref:EAL and HDOD domain-containing protein n=1 Tax=Fundidesulfovibrio terrae TaxID=2922866 RepID=UPI001FB02E2E|nr:HDOD domain-containing protein [Fundidesulfovibrio terrae]
MSTDTGTQIYVDTFFARQPVFDADKHVFGYELLYRKSPLEKSANFSDKDVATLSVISTALLSPPEPNQAGKKIFIHFSRMSILSDVPAALAPQTTVIEVEPVAELPAEYEAALRAVKGKGYSLALNHFIPGECTPKLLELADIVFIDMPGKDEAGLKATLAELGTCQCLLAAKRVEDDAQFQLAKQLGFNLFQGFFFEKPIIVPGRKLPSNKITRLNIYRTLEKDDMDLEELTRNIESDVSISFRLLTFINSLAFGLRYKVDSIRHAIMMLGWQQIKSWLWLVVLSDVMPADKTSELPYLSSIRAKFLERAAHNHHVQSVSPDTLFLMGLFSLLEPMLDTPMRELVGSLPLDDEVKAALCGEKNRYADWLSVARCFESGDWSNLDELTRTLGLDPITVASSYCEALVWAKSLYEQPAGNA